MNPSKTGIIVLTFASLLIMLGCASPITTMASHTIKSGPDSDQDVVWVVAGGSLQRCTAVQNKPVCTKVGVGN